MGLPDASPGTLALQPYPSHSLVSRHEVEGSTVTAIARVWHPGQARRCRLCPAGCCTAYRDSCLVTTTEPVGSGRDLALFRPSGVVAGGLARPLALFRADADADGIGVDVADVTDPGGGDGT